jgi:hypothetical protein
LLSRNMRRSLSDRCLTTVVPCSTHFLMFYVSYMSGSFCHSHLTVLNNYSLSDTKLLFPFFFLSFFPSSCLSPYYVASGYNVRLRNIFISGQIVLSYVSKYYHYIGCILWGTYCDMNIVLFYKMKVVS